MSEQRKYGAAEDRDREYERARPLLERSIALARELGDQVFVGINLHTLADLSLDQTDYSAARRLYEEALSLAQSRGDERLVAYCLAGLAAVAAASGRSRRAATLWGAVEAIEHRVAPLLPFERARYESCLEPSRANLGETTFEDVRAAGETMVFEKAIAYAVRASSPRQETKRGDPVR